MIVDGRGSMRPLALLLAALLSPLACGGAPSAPAPTDTEAAEAAAAARAAETEARIDALLAAMTLEEKIDEIHGLNFMDGRANARLGIPAFLMTDGPHGVRENFGKNTGFPTLVTMGATWDPDLARRFGCALAEEVRARGRNLILGPCINIHRTPLGGRNFESLGEDPWLVSRLAVGYVQGVQSRGVGTSTKHFACNNQEWDRNRVSVEIDERALREIYLPAFRAAVTEAGTVTVMGAYNRLNGDYCNENARLLQDILKNEWGFRYVVLSDWWAIKDDTKAALAGCDMEMPGPEAGGYAFTREKMLPAVRDGRVPETVIDEKVRRILRAKFALGLFDTAAWARGDSAVNTPEHQALAREIAESGMVLLKNDGGVLPLNRSAVRRVAVIGPIADAPLLGGGGSSHVTPPYAVSVVEGVGRLLGGGAEVVYRKGCPMRGALDAVPDSVLRTPDGRPGLRAEYFANPRLEGAPAVVRTDSNVDFDWGGGAPAAGIGADDFSVRWTGTITPPRDGECALSIYSDDGSRLFVDGRKIVDFWTDHGPDGRQATVRFRGGRAHAVRIEYYEKSGGALMRFGWAPPGGDLIAQAAEAARAADAAIVVVGLNESIEGEGVDRGDIFLPAGQDSLVAAVLAANPRTVVVLVNGTPVDMRAWIDSAPAVLEAWYPGMEGGNAVARLLFGEANPCGKLPISFPRRLEDNPSFGNYPGDGDRVRYAEGLFVGYRHYDARNVAPLFPFGHGLSYTTFAYDGLEVAPAEGGGVDVRFDLRNDGARAGAEVAQVYVSDLESSLPRPPQELKGFQKVTLAPGESKRVSVRLGPEAFSFYDPARHAWTTEPGRFRIRVGSSSRDIRLEGETTL